MLVYFAASTTGIPKHQKNYQLIAKSIKKNGGELFHNWFLDKLEKNKDYIDPEIAVKRELDSLAHADLIVAEISTPSFAVGLGINQALNQRIPVLALYPKSEDLKNISGIFLGYYTSYLHLEIYDKNNIDKIISQFFERSGKNSLSKFNFLVSQEISDYLDWAANNKKRSKSDFLREEIKKRIIDTDPDYQKLRKK